MVEQATPNETVKEVIFSSVKMKNKKFLLVDLLLPSLCTCYAGQIGAVYMWYQEQSMLHMKGSQLDGPRHN
ncbi:hypothetical protein BRADI_1g37828v3 [Brachypodium distachyon]|uniref:Uncharacterized protein n=1 Tax=Brachypodium distachyon TaxID=15368 RepID=A0A2K2DNC2_BRADI|nr:hypothetical protein BRADI_1g37828v3 [Brachypodium distachyon]